MNVQCDPYVKNREDFERNEIRNVFVVMRYSSESPALLEIEEAIKKTLKRYGLTAVLARDVAFNQELWSNIRYCMDHSRYGIVIFERLVQPDYNPNVTLELGYMLALRRPTLILKERSLPTLHSNIMGHLYTPFDSHKVSETVSVAVETWLRQLGHTPCPLARTISGTSHLESNKERTSLILEALSQAEHTIRQAASLSSLAISEEELTEENDDGTFQKLLLGERDRIMYLLSQGSTIRIIICPEAQIERVELGLVDGKYVHQNILPRYDQLIKVIKHNINNANLQIISTLRLPHDNLIIIDDKVVFIGRKRRGDRGFPYTTQIFDPAVINDEMSEFDAIFHDNVGPLLGSNVITESHYGSEELKLVLLERLKKSKARIRQILGRKKQKR
jgi:hypothetical protein